MPVKHAPEGAEIVRLVNKRGAAREALTSDAERIAYLRAKGYALPTTEPTGEFAPVDPAPASEV
jgi:hypothetical protein